MNGSVILCKIIKASAIVTDMKIARSTSQLSDRILVTEIIHRRIDLRLALINVKEHYLNFYNELVQISHGTLPSS
jgi:hypothetical protein